MAKDFINENFLLENTTAETLFHEYASGLPLIDFHNHVNPLHISENIQFENISKLWVTEDPYKHRAMRICGIPEMSITGDSSDKNKFLNWARIVPKTIGNPLFHWTSLELKRIFGIDEILSAENAEDIWNVCNEKLQGKGFGAKDILEKWNIDFLCTSDTPKDDLIAHKKLKTLNSTPRIFPSLRCDLFIAFESPSFVEDLRILSEQTKITISTLNDYQSVIIRKLDFFKDSGCFLSDHSLDSGFIFELSSAEIAKKLFLRVLQGEPLSTYELVLLKSFLLKFLGEEYARRSWVMQLHIGAYRYTSSRLRKLVGPNGGYSCIGNTCDVGSLALFLDILDRQDLLPKVILYTLNPADNEVHASLTGSYTQDGVSGKIQMGPAWWYNDHYEGIHKQLEVISNYGLLSQFIGMTTDSRSILSFSRHEYFRRILCNILGKWAEQGQIPNDIPLIGQIVQDVSYYNIKNWISNI